MNNEFFVRLVHEQDFCRPAFPYTLILAGENHFWLFLVPIIIH